MSNGDVQEEALEKAYWDFDADSKKSGMERDAFKRQMRGYSSALRKENTTLHAENAALLARNVELEKLAEEMSGALKGASQHYEDVKCGFFSGYDEDIETISWLAGNAEEALKNYNSFKAKSLPVTAERGGGVNNQVRKKPCRHCLFTKNHLGRMDAIGEIRHAADSASSSFPCHEHTERTICCMYAKRHPENIPAGAIKTSENGDLKHKFSNLTRAEMDNYSMGGI